MPWSFTPHPRNPHPDPLPEGEGICGGAFLSEYARFCRFPTSGVRSFSGVIRSGGPPYPGPIWPDLAWFTPRGLRSKPGCEVPVCTGTTEEWPGAAKLLFWFRLVPFRSISCPPNPHLDSSLRWNDGVIRVNDVCEQCSNLRGHGAMGNCRWFPACTGTAGGSLRISARLAATTLAGDSPLANALRSSS